MQSAAETLTFLAQIAFIELALFAAVGFIVGGLDELLIDAIWLVRTGWRRLTIYRRHARTFAADLPEPSPSFRVAVFIPTWHEADVITPMLRHALAAYRGLDIAILVACYPNDLLTIAAVQSVASDRIRIVIGDRHGPTTKADNLNTLWRALSADDRQGFDAVCLHDAEDLISPFEARVVAHLLPGLASSNCRWCRWFKARAVGSAATIATNSPSPMAKPWSCERRWAQRCRWRG